MVVAPTDSVPSASAFREAIRRHARYSLAQPWETLSARQIFECVSLAVRDIMVDRLLESEQRYRQADAKHLYYLSIEYLPGRYLANNLINLGLYDLCRETLGQMGVDLDSRRGERALTPPLATAGWAVLRPASSTRSRHSACRATATG